MGRRNWLFADTVAGATANASLYSLQQSCQVNGIDGYRHLRALFAALPNAKIVDGNALHCCPGEMIDADTSRRWQGSRSLIAYI